MMLYWIDKTDFLQMQKKYNEEKNAIMLIQVDGYVKATDIEFIVKNTNEIQKVTMIDKIAHTD